MLIKLIPKKTEKKNVARQRNEMRNCEIAMHLSLFLLWIEISNRMATYYTKWMVKFSSFYLFIHFFKNLVENLKQVRAKIWIPEEYKVKWMDGWVHQTNSERKEKGKKKIEDWPSVISVITGMIDFQSKKTTDMITRKTN